LEDIFREKGLIKGRYYFSGSPGFWEEIDPESSIFFLGGEGAGAVFLINGQWRAYAYIPAEQFQHLISSRKKVEAKKAVVDFYRRLLK